ncbi:MAG: molecular chaperone DnaJ [Nitriliruptorales bacterium]|nr:molecular chaperone DnaJ [Nitriliruptorales bacterium]
MAQRDYFEKDYYAVLGVPKDASSADVSKAYRKLARDNHPDSKPGDVAAENRFKEISEAYSVLSNAEKRKEYDEVREMVSSGAFRGGFPGGGFPGGGGGGFGGGGFDLNDLLGAFRNGGAGGFGGGRRQTVRTARRGRDVEADLTLSFADAMAGVTTSLRVSGQAPCSTCNGSGAAPGTMPVTCSVCSGAGVTASNQGLFSFSEPCTACNGTGRQIPTPCPSCGGQGTEIRTRSIRARIPAGVRDGARIRLAGKGEAGTYGGPSGDLYVNVHVEPHPVFGRKGEHLTLTVPITFAEAALGTRMTVPTLGDPVTLKVPAGTESGRTFRVKGRGAPTTRGGTGDLLVTVEVAIPRKLTRTQRKALEAFADLDGGNVREHLEPYLSAPEPAGA